MTTQPPSDSTESENQINAFDMEPSFGWNQYAEKINGRFAMIGFVALLITDFITQQDFFSWIGLR